MFHNSLNESKLTADMKTEKRADDAPIDFEVDVGDAPVGQIVITVNRQTKILSRDNHIVMLDDDVIGKGSRIHLLHITHDIMERHTDLKVKCVGHVIHARVWLGFGVDLSIEQLGCTNLGYHFSCSTQN